MIGIEVCLLGIVCCGFRIGFFSFFKTQFASKENGFTNNLSSSKTEFSICTDVYVCAKIVWWHI